LNSYVRFVPLKIAVSKKIKRVVLGARFFF
jgi:hypothetical protein